MSLVALLSDFGLADPYVAEMKLQLLRLGPPDLRLLDISHAIAPGDIEAAAWVVRRCWPQLPPGGVLLAVVDPGVGGARPAIAAAGEGRYFVGPGNGLAASLDRGGGLQVVRLGDVDPPAGLAAATTFAGRDLFAPAAARLAAGEPLTTLGETGTTADLGPPLAPADALAVVWIDRFGNLVTGLTPTSRDGRLLAAGAARLSVAGRPVRGPLRAYCEASPGELICYWGSGGTLEIARRDGSAADLVAARVGLVAVLENP